MIVTTLQRQEFGIVMHKTRAMIIVQITSLTKLRFLFKRAGINTQLDKKILNGGKAKVIVTETVPFIIRYNKNRERASVTFRYSVWNKHGVLLSINITIM